MQAQTAQTSTGPRFLGTNAKFLHGEAPKPETKTLRFKLLRQAQGVLFKADTDHKEQHRTCWCHRSMRGETVNVWRGDAGNNARFTGLSTCGSVWTCPVCAPMIQDARRDEISKAMVEWTKNQAGVVLFMTLTHPHEADLPLAEQLAKREKAEQRFKNSRVYKRMKEKHGRAGSIRSLEVTWGMEHGFHPHTHDLIFLKDNLIEGYAQEELNDPTTYRGYLAELRDTWIKCLIKAGLGGNIADMQRRAFQLQDGQKAAEYMAKFGRDIKWGLSSEMTATHAKIGAAGSVFGKQHFTPFQMLLWAGTEQNPAARAIMRRKFKEYADAFTGKRAMTWTPKLKALLKVKDLTDEEIIDAHEKEPLPEESMAGSLTSEQFNTLTRHNHLGEFLAYVRDYCHNPESSQGDIDDYLEHLAGKAPPMPGGLLQKNNYGPDFVRIH